MDTAAEIGRNPISKHQTQPGSAAWHGTELPNPYRETKFLGANGDRETFIFPFQLTTSRIGNLTRLTLILTFAIIICDDRT